jgi:hypothetical protein
MRSPPILILASFLGLAPVACTDAGSPPQSGIRFEFSESHHQETVQLEIANSLGLAQADTLLRSGEERWAAGTPLRGDGGFNAPWHWHFDPATVSFPQVTIEACQTWPSAVDQDLDYWIAFGQVCVRGTLHASHP